jgi:hypothetical protein
MKSSWFRSSWVRWFPVSAGKERRPRVRPRLEALEDRRLFATDLWTNSLGGDWSVGSNWSLGAPPGSADDAVIPSYAAGITIGHGAGNDTVHDLTASANLAVSGGSLTVAGTFKGHSGQRPRQHRGRRGG